MSTSLSFWQEANHLISNWSWTFIRRIYNTAQHLFKNPLGIHRNTLLSLMSAFYPNNSTMATLLYEQMSNGTGLGFDIFVEYLGNVYTILNEVRCFVFLS